MRGLGHIRAGRDNLKGVNDFGHRSAFTNVTIVTKAPDIPFATSQVSLWFMVAISDVGQCCPTFMIPQATKEINLEVAGRTSKFKSND